MTTPELIVCVSVALGVALLCVAVFELLSGPKRRRRR